MTPSDVMPAGCLVPRPAHHVQGESEAPPESVSVLICTPRTVPQRPAPAGGSPCQRCRAEGASEDGIPAPPVSARMDDSYESEEHEELACMDGSSDEDGCGESDIERQYAFTGASKEVDEPARLDDSSDDEACVTSTDFEDQYTFDYGSVAKAIEAASPLLFRARMEVWKTMNLAAARNTLSVEERMRHAQEAAAARSLRLLPKAFWAWCKADTAGRPQDVDAGTSPAAQTTTRQLRCGKARMPSGKPPSSLRFANAQAQPGGGGPGPGLFAGRPRGAAAEAGRERRGRALAAAEAQRLPDWVQAAARGAALASVFETPPPQREGLSALLARAAAEEQPLARTGLEAVAARVTTEAPPHSPKVADPMFEGAVDGVSLVVESAGLGHLEGARKDSVRNDSPPNLGGC